MDKIKLQIEELLNTAFQKISKREKSLDNKEMELNIRESELNQFATELDTKKLSIHQKEEELKPYQNVKEWEIR